MTKEELELALKEQQSIINKNQRLAREFNKAVREAKKKQKGLKSAFRKQEIERRKTEREKIKIEKRQCVGVDLLDNQCTFNATIGDYCRRHSPLIIRCKNEYCKIAALENSLYCIKHDPNYELVLVDASRNWRQWKKKGVAFCENAVEQDFESLDDVEDVEDLFDVENLFDDKEDLIEE